jgi:hypothetical protein
MEKHPMTSILESKQSGRPDLDKGFDMHRKEIAAYTGSHRLVLLTWKRIYEIIKSRSKFHLKEGHFLSKHWGGDQQAKYIGLSLFSQIGEIKKFTFFIEYEKYENIFIKSH